jgi:hypothetical protein
MHVISTVGLCPPRGVELDDGGLYKPSKAQRWLWSCWVDYWQRVAEMRQGAALVVLINGDWVDGDHHDTPQIATTNPATMIDAMVDVMKPALKLAPDAIIVVRGTESHVGKSGYLEEIAARAIGAAPDSETGTDSWFTWCGDLDGVRIHAAHHGTSGNLPYTKLNTFARSVYTFGAAHPDVDLMIRNHKHRFLDTAGNFRLRGLMSASWQLSTAFGHRIAPGDLLPVGGWIIRCSDGKFSAEKKNYEPKRGKVWKLPKTS